MTLEEILLEALMQPIDDRRAGPYGAFSLPLWEAMPRRRRLWLSAYWRGWSLQLRVRRYLGLID